MSSLLGPWEQLPPAAKVFAVVFLIVMCSLFRTFGPRIPAGRHVAAVAAVVLGVVVIAVAA